MTGIGAVIKISDQGNGFDVPRFIRDRVFHRKGSGLYRFRKTSSVISYADGGQTLLIRFLCDAEADRSAAATHITTTTATSSPQNRTFRVAGITVVTDHHTEVRDGVHVEGETPRPEAD